jgi:hypothetical protein
MRNASRFSSAARGGCKRLLHQGRRALYMAHQDKRDTASTFVDAMEISDAYETPPRAMNIAALAVILA